MMFSEVLREYLLVLTRITCLGRIFNIFCDYDLFRNIWRIWAFLILADQDAMSLSLSLHPLCTSYCLLSFVILSDQPLSGKHAMSCWSQLEATCLYFCHRLKEKRYVLGFSFRSRLLSYLYQVVQSSSCHHHEKRKRIMMQTVECRCSWWCRWPPSWWGC